MTPIDVHWSGHVRVSIKAIENKITIRKNKIWSFGNREICWISVREWKEYKVVDSGGKKHIIPLGVGREVYFYKSSVWKGEKTWVLSGERRFQRRYLKSALPLLYGPAGRLKTTKLIACESEFSKNWQWDIEPQNQLV